MTITKWMRKKAMNRLAKVENLNIGRREKKAKRIAMWTLIDILVWTLVVTGLPGETIVIENAVAREMPESAVDAGAIVDTAEDGERVGSETVGESIESLIRAAFPDNSDEALAIAKCESGLNPERVGDHALAFMHNGQEYGKSYGLFQVRSGGIEKNGKIWTRTDNVEQFENDMKDPEKNLEAAKKIYRGNWGPWENCAVKEGLL